MHHICAKQFVFFRATSVLVKFYCFRSLSFNKHVEFTVICVLAGSEVLRQWVTCQVNVQGLKRDIDKQKLKIKKSKSAAGFVMSDHGLNCLH